MLVCVNISAYGEEEEHFESLGASSKNILTHKLYV